MPVYFSPPCKCRGRNQTNEGVRVCVQSLGASIFQLINFIFTHLFLNVLSDGNAAGCSSEVLTWQMGLKRGSQPVSEAGFQFKVSFFFLLLFMKSENYPWRVHWAYRACCLFNTKATLDQFGAVMLRSEANTFLKIVGGEELLMYVFFQVSKSVGWLKPTAS